MENAAYIGMSRKMALARRMDMVANNVANMSTTGFKARSMMFMEHVEKAKGTAAENTEKISMVVDYGSYMSMRQGPMLPTGNQLDMAIEGDGFFALQAGGGETFYSRAGNFQIDRDNQLVNQNGLPVLGDGDAPIQIPPGTRDISVKSDGSLLADDVQIGQLKIVEFDRNNYLEPVSGGVYRTNEPEKDPENSLAIQGFLEGSNVNAIGEMTNMINVMRSYQSTERMLSKENERLRDAVNRIARQT